jgi:hypothetical protein
MPRDTQALALAAHDELLKYISVHNDIYGAPPWRALRRLLPIPWLFEAIPYGAHADILQAVRDALEEIRGEAASISSSADKVMSAPLLDYVRALQYAVSLLQEICSALADKSEGAAYSWGEYRRSTAEYERARLNYARLGGLLNESFRATGREA